MKLLTKQITQTALLLSICIASQFFKNLSVYITGPIINICIILTVLMIGLGSGVILSIVTPVTAFLIAPSPIMSGIPLVIPCIMIGNSILAISVWVFQKKLLMSTASIRVIIGIVVGAISKAIFMGVTIVLILLPLFSGNIAVPAQKLPILLQTAKVTFSITQFVTAIIGGVISYVIWLRIKNINNI